VYQVNFTCKFDLIKTTKSDPFKREQYVYIYIYIYIYFFSFHKKHQRFEAIEEMADEEYGGVETPRALI